MLAVGQTYSNKSHKYFEIHSIFNQKVTLKYWEKGVYKYTDYPIQTIQKFIKEGSLIRDL